MPSSSHMKTLKKYIKFLPPYEIVTLNYQEVGVALII